MLPDQNKLTIHETPLEFLYTTNIKEQGNPLVCVEKGGLALGDTSRGLVYQDWSLAYVEESKQFKLTNESGFELILQTLDDSNIKVLKVALTFDQNMKQVWGYSYKLNNPINDIFNFSRFYWYDVISNKFVQNTLENVSELNITLDDKRQDAGKFNDIIVSYINTDSRFCVRYQRERYGIEYPLLKLPPFTKVAKMGMTKNFRFQIELHAINNYKHTETEFLLGGI